jgi:hypothetical protein
LDVLAPHPTKAHFCAARVRRRKRAEQRLGDHQDARLVVNHLASALLKDLLAAERVAHDLDGLAGNNAPPPQREVRVVVARKLAQKGPSAHLLRMEAPVKRPLRVFFCPGP